MINRATSLGIHGIVLAILVTAIAALTYQATHYRYLLLNDRLQQQRYQQRQLHKYQQALSQEPVLAPANNQWRWPELADSLGLAITVQPAQAEQQPTRLSITGSAVAVRRFLSSEADTLTEPGLPLRLSQLLTWQTHAKQRVQVRWHIQQQWVDDYLLPWDNQSDTNRECRAVKPASSNNHTDLRGYQLAAIVTEYTARDSQSTAYLTNTNGPSLRLLVGQWVQHPLARVHAISVQGITLRRWQLVNDCWHYEDTTYQLKESL